MKELIRWLREIASKIILSEWDCCLKYKMIILCKKIRIA
jgi:hypothetical protein